MRARQPSIQRARECPFASTRRGPRRTEQKVHLAVPSQLALRHCRVTLELSRFAHGEALRVIPPPRCTKTCVVRTAVFGLVLEIRQFVRNGVVAAALSIPQSASVHGRGAVCGGPRKGRPAVPSQLARQRFRITLELRRCATGEALRVMCRCAWSFAIAWCA